MYPNILEKDVKRDVLNYLATLKARGRLHYWEIYNGPRIVSVGRKKVFIKNPSPGIPDLIIMPPNLTLWTELKRPKGGVLSADQKEFQKACAQMGHTYLIWTSLTDCVEYLGKLGIKK